MPMVLAANAFATVSPALTVSVALAAAPLLPELAVVTAPIAIELLYVPAIALVTFTVTVQEPDAGIVPPESATLVPPLVAVTAPPAQLVAPVAGVALTRPGGYVSVNAAPVIAVAFGLVNVTVSVEVPLMPIEVGLKALVTTGPFNTVSVAEAPAAVPVSVATAPVLLRYAPAAALATLTVTVHEPLAGIVPLASATLLRLLAAVTAPPAHVVAPLAAAVFTSPAGYVSVNAALVIAVAFGLVSVMVRTLGALTPTVAGVKDFAAVAVASTVSVMFAAPVLAPALVEVSPPIGIELA